MFILLFLKNMHTRDDMTGERHDQEATATTPLLKRNDSPRPSRDGSLSRTGSQQIDDAWDATDNHRNPRNWSFAFKWATVALVSFIEFLTYVVHHRPLRARTDKT